MDGREVRPLSNFYDQKVALVLQGGDALESYQASVYEVLASSNYLPDWVAGVSIGAINAGDYRRKCSGQFSPSSSLVLCKP